MAAVAASSSPPAAIICRAAVAWGPGQPLVMEQVEVAPPGPMEIRVKVVCTSVCRSDVSAWQSKAQPDLFPQNLRARSIRVRALISHFATTTSGKPKPFDWIVVLTFAICKLLMCRVVESVGEGATEFQVGRPLSSFSEYTVVHSGCAVKVGPTVPMDRVCLLSCGVSAGLGAAWNVANVSTGSSVAIFGLGTVGLSVAQGAKLRGASKIIGIDTNPEKQEKGKAFGITDFINPDELNEPVQQGWGVTVTLGVPKAKPEVSAHYAFLLFGRTLKGSLFGGWRPKSDLPSLVDKYADKEIQVDDLVTHDIQFNDINKALDLMLENKCLRCVIHMALLDN
ncbi:hypothetical protein PR202_gb09173 [Eleusine coracana subsp. coracana]|uniref:Alcohol dehydrogenase-like C-terminal domain-containing protein n=1 Tax=Eleusine coracana subsp. coracana TaxID=191504 RepID=A0AAV5EE70_ELECO|nr:hypothetical protein PR202_gb09173 [Eleusine coracana subsp. coracana]